MTQRADFRSAEVPTQTARHQLIPSTFRKPAPHPLPACSTQAIFQCLLLYLSLELQYYWEDSGRLILPDAFRTVGRSVLLTAPLWTVSLAYLYTVITFPALSGNPSICPRMTIVYTYWQQLLACNIFITLNAGRLLSISVMMGKAENEELRLPTASFCCLCSTPPNKFCSTTIKRGDLSINACNGN